MIFRVEINRDLTPAPRARLSATLSATLSASEFLLEELKVLCEHSARKIVSVANVAKMLLAAEKYHAETLKNSCLSYVQKNMAEVRACCVDRSCKSARSVFC